MSIVNVFIRRKKGEFDNIYVRGVSSLLNSGALEGRDWRVYDCWALQPVALAQDILEEAKVWLVASFHRGLVVLLGLLRGGDSSTFSVVFVILLLVVHYCTWLFPSIPPYPSCRTHPSHVFGSG
jgi:hypothetical protein